MIIVSYIQLYETFIYLKKGCFFFKPKHALRIFTFMSVKYTQIRQTCMIIDCMAYLLSFEIAGMAVKPHQFNSLVVGARSKKVTGRAPCQTINAALMVLRTLQKHGGRDWCAVVSVQTNKHTLAKKFKTTLNHVTVSN